MSTVEQSFVQGGRRHTHTFPLVSFVKMLVLIILVLNVPALPHIASIALLKDAECR